MCVCLTSGGVSVPHRPRRDLYVVHGEGSHTQRHPVSAPPGMPNGDCCAESGTRMMLMMMMMMIILMMMMMINIMIIIIVIIIVLVSRRFGQSGLELCTADRAGIFISIQLESKKRETNTWECCKILINLPLNWHLAGSNKSSRSCRELTSAIVSAYSILKPACADSTQPINGYHIWW